MAVRDYDLFDPSVRECPYPFYQALREEAPVYRVPGQGFFLVSRFEDIATVVANPKVFSSATTGRAFGQMTPEIEAILALGKPQAPTLVTVDHPEHTRQRRLANKPFYARIGKQEANLRAAAQGLVDAFCSSGHVEFVSQFAVPLALSNIGGLMGLPPEDLGLLKRWADDSRTAHAGIQSHERQLELTWSEVEMQRYFDLRLEERLADPGEDFISDVAHSQLDGEGSPSRAVRLSLLIQLFRAGHQTTIGMLTNGMLLLVQHPDQMELVQADPSLIPNFLEEVIRLESPIQGMFRVATVDTELAGQPIPAGSRLYLLYASGSRDDEQFPNPQVFDVRRASQKEHLGFGRGAHYCIGAPLARLVGRVAFETLLAGLGHVRPGSVHPYYRYVLDVVSVRVLDELHLEFDPRRPAP